MKYKVRMAVIMHPDKATTLKQVISQLKEGWAREFKDITADRGMLTVKNLEKERSPDGIFKLANVLTQNNAEGMIIALSESDEMLIRLNKDSYSVEQRPLS